MATTSFPKTQSNYTHSSSTKHAEFATSNHQSNPHKWYSDQTGVYSSKHPPVSLPQDTFLDVVSHVFSHKHNGKTALIDAASGFSISYPELQRLVKSMASGLHQMGVSKGDVVLILLPNSVYYPVILLGVLYLGAVVTTMNPFSSFSEVKKQTLGTHVTMAFTLVDKVDELKSLGIQTVVVPENVPFDATHVRFKRFYKLISGDHGLVPRRTVRQDDTAVILYSSGTTGASKGVVLSHRNLISGVELFVRFEDSCYPLVPEENVYLAVIPMFHIYGLTLFNLGILSLGTKIVVMKRFIPDEMVRSIDRYGVTHFPGVPPLLTALTKAAKGALGRSLKSLKQVSCGAAPLSTRTIEEFMTYFPQVDFIQGYGLSESTAVGTRGFNTRDLQNYTSAGLLAPNTQARVVDFVTGLYLPPGKTGELWLSGPAIMKEYLNDVEATSSTIDKDGWLHTGDIVYFDQDGYLHIVGRVKEIIKYNGFQIAPADLEDVLATHPAILDAAVTGVRDDEAGEVPVAFVVLKPGAEASESSIIDFVAKQVAPYKKVRRVIFVKMIPRSAAGKILRRELKEPTYSRL
ncbi:putative AMP-dependent synthetase/ligase, AMP-binding enzyme domain-containing protein [Helianthus annuus]|uniref:4-coumarate--CoA ligase n=1 Tax=Helianthus annuus TaxID=4232 RepID=A0A251VA54_HELAN|nr:4-coumarate--CoA ligase-like 6 [Helianthus annuus]KAF5815632.1 putative AMP-dependent synthetase/ligase, AMP-binding enzyme domain-containing protein [Helianthus annuus]KAJ0594054.1 putative AMP-dependent synthetase/ligase, AMP-binding, AMP-binding enzyme domain, ANL [Helianthus annuus]KAJ0602134.1 putative AMP-dependent synthetase/ligase, AMP-binding, AMP-binding enzyme domain-containing protein [Helianthus annuus]KAJ0769139.1 putative AMP-dependent synthetase/ligase, AMP-binding, AMP-bindi